MASLDDLKKRIASVKSTQKITKAMKMVAAAKLKRAQDSAEKGRPYSEKMNNIISIDNESMTITVEPGVILSNIHEQVEKNDLFFPLSLGAKGSCTIGGNLSTNAGGINVLKYGNTRDLCLGLEVVLPNGDIMDLLKILKKDNTGYDLKNIFIGAEGTLGIITAATLKLFQLPKMITTLFVEANEISNAIKLLNTFKSYFPDRIESFELMPKSFWEVAKNNIICLHSA